MTLTEFLLAQIAIDEAVARAAHEAASGQERWWVDGPALHSRKHWVYQTGEKFTERAVAEHIARHDPARVLADCKAKRRIVEQWREADKAEEEYGGEGDGWPEIDRLRSVEFALADVLRALVQVYADRPGFDPAWRI